MDYLVRTNGKSEDFIRLVAQLDAELAIIDGEDHAFYAELNKTDKIKHVITAHTNGWAMGCGALKRYNAKTMEIKRMYITPEYRGKGQATIILQRLEEWAWELDYARVILETSHKQPDAIALYKKNGYTVIPNYGQYKGVDMSICFEKKLPPPRQWFI